MSDNILVTDISQREFVRHFSRYLKECGSFRVHGRETYCVEISGLSEKTLNHKEIPKMSDNNVTTYGCGCERDKSALCKKHGRY